MTEVWIIADEAFKIPDAVLAELKAKGWDGKTIPEPEQTVEPDEPEQLQLEGVAEAARARKGEIL